MRKSLSITLPLLITLAVLAMVGPLSIDMYLPGFPEIAHDLHTVPGTVQFTLAFFMLGMGLGQLFWGPVSDALGRYRPLALASTLFVVVSVVAALADNIYLLIGARFFQGFMGCAGLVIGRAIARDLATGHKLAQVFGLLGIIMGIAPISAPVLGGLIVDTVSWHGVMWLLVAIAIIMLSGVLLFVPESLPVERRAAVSPAALGENLKALFTSRKYLGYAFGFMFGFAVMFAFISSSSYVLQTTYHLTTLQYTLCFALNAVGLLIAGSFNTRMVREKAPAQMQSFFTPATLVATGLLLIVTVSMVHPPLWALMAGVILSCFFMISGMANFTTLSMERVKGSQAGLASAIMGAGQFLVAGVVTALVSVSGSPDLHMMSWIMFVAALIAAISFFFIARGRDDARAARAAQ